MRAVLAHYLPLPSLIQKQPLPNRNDDLLCLGNPPAHLPFDPQQNSYAKIATHFPSGWQPQVYLHWSLEYNPVPQGLEEAECFTVGIVGDWNLGGQAFQQVGGAFDLLLADKEGCTRLQAAGYENVRYARLWAYDARLHRRLEGVERDLDIVMVGNFNHDVQYERSRWLARIARLSRKYRVCVTSKVFGEDYVRLLNRAKIVFNRSIRGEINMRAYEAPACGAVMFYERENPEIQDILTDRQECVLYGEDDLEALLDYYLRHDEEREQIAEAGYRKIQAHSYEQHLAEALTTVESAMREDGPRSRVFLSLPPAERSCRYAYQWMLIPDLRNLVAAEALLLNIQSQATERADIANALAYLTGAVADLLPASEEQSAIRQQAIRHAQRALELRPDYAVARLNLAHLCQADTGQVIETELAQVIQTLRADTIRAEQLCGPYYPRRFEAFDVELERSWGYYRPDSQDWTAAMRTLILWSAWTDLSEYAFNGQRFLEAAQYATEAVLLRPEVGAGCYRLARALRLLGHREGAEARYRQAIETAPFLLSAWEELAQLYSETQRADAALALLDELDVILDGCPIYDYARPVFDRLRMLAQQRAARQAARETAQAPLLRLLAFPDWSQPDQWQPLVRAFASAYQPADPALLMLRADPANDSPAEALLRSLEVFLTCQLGLAASELPNITLLNQPLTSGEEWTLFHTADALIAAPGSDSDAAHRTQAAAAHVPVWTLEEMTESRR
jgi:tetratricopeptide (TPR) repeat protein